MFAGLPGIGVGTLFYVLMAFWMPIREIERVVRGQSSLARWKSIARQMFYASAIVATVMFAERVLLWLVAESPQPFSPAALVHHELGSRAGESILAAPIVASLLLLGGVIFAVEALRIIVRLRTPTTALPEERDAVVRKPGRGTTVQQPLEIS
jgi:hypothetical protein